MVLDLVAEDLPSIVTYVVDDLVIHDHIKSEHKGKVLKTLLMKHKYVCCSWSISMIYAVTSRITFVIDIIQRVDSFVDA